MKNKRAILPSEIVKLLVGLVVLVAILVPLAVKLVGVYTTKNDGLDRAKSSLNAVINSFKKLEVGKPEEILVDSPLDWNFIVFEGSSDAFAGCGTEFCICMCRSGECPDLNYCEQIDKFVLLRDIDKKEHRILDSNFPEEFVLTFDDSEVYVYNEGVSFEEGIFLGEEFIPLLYKFDGEWMWSVDLEHWMKTDVKKVSGGARDGGKVTEKNSGFLNELNKVKTDEFAGKTLFLSKDSKKSKGIYILEIKK